jgi:hypothetical protein
MIRHIIASCSTVRIRNERYYRDKDDLSSAANVTIENEKEREREWKKKSEKKVFFHSILLFLVIVFSLSRFSRVCAYIIIQRMCVCVVVFIPHSDAGVLHTL